MEQKLLRKGNFDSAHRIVNHPGKCANLHGHSYLYELEFSFDPSENNKGEEIGYAIDFADIKKVAAKYLDDVYDHAAIYNPQDQYLRPFLNTMAVKMRQVPMYLNGPGMFCNPSVENIAAQIFIEISYLCNTDKLKLSGIKLYETPNCWTVATLQSVPNLKDVIFGEWNKYPLPKHLEKWKSEQE